MKSWWSTICVTNKFAQIQRGLSMHKTYKYRLYPTKAQQTAMQKALDACRWVHNKALEVRKTAWERERCTVSMYDTFEMIPNWKQKYSFLFDAHSQSLRGACTRVDLAFQSFFRHVKAGQQPGYPRFRGKNYYSSITYANGSYRFLDNERLYLSKIGDVKIVLHRPIGGDIRVLTVKRDTIGNWYACFSCKVEISPLPPSSKVVGVDVGLTHFITLSTGEHIPNPRFFRRNEKVLVKAQRRLSRCVKGSSDYRRCKRVIQHIYKRIVCCRHNFIHQISKQLVDKFQVIALEDLDIRNMQNGNWLAMNKSIADAAWHQFIDCVSYKATYAGRSSPRVNPRGTTQECSSCGRTVKKGLSERVHNCPNCGLNMDRDVNAALNILGRGLASMGSNP